MIQNPQDIGKKFNKFVISVGSKLAKKMSNTVKKFQGFLTSHNEKMQFEEAFKSLKRNRASGFDDLGSNIIIDAYHSLKNVLFHVDKVSFNKEYLLIAKRLLN